MRAIGVVNAVTTGQRRRDWGQQLVSRMAPTRRVSQIYMAVHQSTQSPVMGQGDWKQQSGIGYQAVVIKGHMDAVRPLRW